MEDLRTLVARALAGGDYSPAESARVRAVPDVRTIRYYTTLGLLKPPAVMLGRTAYYNETHVMQLVAIKRLQAQNLSLADIQQRLVGLTNSRLATLAKLPEGFWKAADQYLEKPTHQPRRTPPVAVAPTVTPAVIPTVAPGTTTPSATSTSTPAKSLPESVSANNGDVDGDAFWLTPAVLPMSIAEEDCYPVQAIESIVHAVVELHLAKGVRIDIQFPTASKTEPVIDTAALYAAAQPLLKELIRQRIVRT